ncbi:hypothetical protein BDZ91DRAFT_795177 [Kalaharituber pfeilii]|nr:hypothetical protein BDZ91DRAFT_795177 [Kalaharituber pfeilii]
MHFCPTAPSSSFRIHAHPVLKRASLFPCYPLYTLLQLQVQARWMAAEMQMRASHGPDLLMASGLQAPAPLQQQFQQPAPQAYPSLPVGMQMGANWAPPPEDALQQQLPAAPDDGYAWAGIGHDVPAPVQEPLSDYDATIARQLASQMAWFPQDASEEFDASYQLAPEESRLFMRPKL